MVYGSVVLIYVYFFIWPLGLLIRLNRTNRTQENTLAMPTMKRPTRRGILNSPNCRPLVGDRVNQSYSNETSELEKGRSEANGVS